MIEFASKFLKENDIKTFYLEVNENNSIAIKVYEKLGFKQEHCPNDEYTKMHCNKHRITATLKELPFEIDYTETEAEKVNLNIFLD